MTVVETRLVLDPCMMNLTGLSSCMSEYHSCMSSDVARARAGGPPARVSRVSARRACPAWTPHSMHYARIGRADTQTRPRRQMHDFGDLGREQAKKRTRW